MISIARLARRLRGEEGVALPVVLGLGLAMLILITGSLTISASAVTKSSTDEDWNAAFAAAYAGVQEYESRLMNDATYMKYGNPASTFSATSTVTLPKDGSGNLLNPAFDTTAGGQWAGVAGSSNGASYRYEVNNADYYGKGLLYLRSTGRVGTQTRTIVANLKQQGFLNFLYFTVYEIQDPQLSGAPSSCAAYSYGTGARDTSSSTSCPTIQFGPFDKLYGPVHSNDQLKLCGGEFHYGVTSSSTTNPIYSTSGCGGSPVFYADNTTSTQIAAAKGVTFKSVVNPPLTNTQLKKETRNDLTSSDVPRPGCLYTGPTQIIFTVQGGVSMMRVISPWTVQTQTPTAPTNFSQCGKPGTGSGNLGDPNGALVPALDANLIYVQDVPAALSGDPNAAPLIGTRNGVTCTVTTDSTGTYYGGWQLGSTKYPMNNEVMPKGNSSSTPSYGCLKGDAYVEGTTGSATTIATDNYIYVTDNLLYQDYNATNYTASAGLLGLIGQGGVFVWNPRNSSNSPLNGRSDRTINAAILSVQHTFQVQNYDLTGVIGKLTVFGAIAQKFRGPVATTNNGTTISNGYTKNYHYDQRYLTSAPPKFLMPTSTTYGITQSASVPSVFSATGAPQ